MTWEQRGWRIFDQTEHSLLHYSPPNWRILRKLFRRQTHPVPPAVAESRLTLQGQTCHILPWHPRWYLNNDDIWIPRFSLLPSYSSSSSNSSSVTIFIKQRISVAVAWLWTLCKPGTWRVTRWSRFFGAAVSVFPTEALWNHKSQKRVIVKSINQKNQSLSIYHSLFTWTMSFLSPNCMPFKPAIAVSVICGSAYSQNAYLKKSVNKFLDHVVQLLHNAHKTSGRSIYLLTLSTNWWRYLWRDWMLWAVRNWWESPEPKNARKGQKWVDGGHDWDAFRSVVLKNIFIEHFDLTWSNGWNLKESLKCPEKRPISRSKKFLTRCFGYFITLMNTCSSWR